MVWFGGWFARFGVGFYGVLLGLFMVVWCFCAIFGLSCVLICAGWCCYSLLFRVEVLVDCLVWVLVRIL